jgi:hypothetical protein
MLGLNGEYDWEEGEGANEYLVSKSLAAARFHRLTCRLGKAAISGPWKTTADKSRMLNALALREPLVAWWLGS